MDPSSEFSVPVSPMEEDCLPGQGADRFRQQHTSRFYGETLDRLLARDPQVLAWFAADTTGLIRSRIRRHVPESIDNEELAVELHVDCLAHIVRKLDHFKPERNVKVETWATVVCDNRLLDYLRSTKNSIKETSLDRAISGHEGLVIPVSDESSDPARIFGKKDRREALVRCLDEIQGEFPAYHRDVKIVRAELDLVTRGQQPSLAAQGALIGESASTVCRARQAWQKNGFAILLRSRLEKHGVWPWED
mgnify:CR=1 FL=1